MCFFLKNQEGLEALLYWLSQMHFRCSNWERACTRKEVYGSLLINLNLAHDLLVLRLCSHIGHENMKSFLTTATTKNAGGRMKPLFIKLELFC